MDLLRKVVRLKIAKCLIGWILTHMSFFLPVKKLKETGSLYAFHHPQPSYLLHILIVPKRPYASLKDVSTEDTTFLVDLFKVTQELIQEYHLDQTGYRLIVNGGSFQDIPHLHFHLVADQLTQDRANTTDSSR